MVRSTSTGGGTLDQWRENKIPARRKIRWAAKDTARHFLKRSASRHQARMGLLRLDFQADLAHPRAAHRVENLHDVAVGEALVGPQGHAHVRDCSQGFQTELVQLYT